MFRLTLISLLAVCALARAAPNPSHYSLNSFLTEDSTEDYSVQPFGALTNIFTNIKIQFKQILKEVLVQIMNYFLSIAEQVKVKLLKKLGTYTLADILNFVCDFVTDLIVIPVSEEDFDMLPMRLAIQTQPAYESRGPSLLKLLSAGDSHK